MPKFIIHFALVWTLLMTTEPLAVASSRTNLPKGLSNLIPSGFKLDFITTGDLDGNGISDYLLVLGPINTSAASAVDPDITRPVLLVINDGKGILRIVARNDHAIPCEACGGAQGDPFGGIDIAKGRFSIHQWAGSHGKCHQVTTFRYSDHASQWQLWSIKVEFSDIDPLPRPVLKTRAEGLTPVNFMDFQAQSCWDDWDN
ncbi:MAG: hypothetical protein Q7T36_16025 [Fluviicoccus sp.]|uniref:hypothetical protein n=1 Tax=Fluviicoccus sp. TaxID=2003552 RepID=UPI002724A217|nr:hypothetical protein [Fluviicoccus sp.]MDO8331973.1 hypothetical protein [Fluviicoccus sp.]